MQFSINLLPLDHDTNTELFFKDGQYDSITIHYTGEQFGQTPQVVRKWLARDNNEASYHFIVKDNLCLQIQSTEKCVYHCGHPTGNRTSLAIGVIPDSEHGEFSEASMKTLKELLFLLRHVPLFRHYDWNGKPCPAWYVDEEHWKQLKLAIQP